MKIDNMKLIDSAGSLIAKFDMIGQHLTIRGFGIFRKAAGGTWIGEPSTRYQKRDGTTDYIKHVIITDLAVKEEIERQAKEALAALEIGSEQSADSEDIPI